MKSSIVSSLLILGLVCVFPRQTACHGRLWTPPGRSTAWRFPEFAHYNLTEDYDDNQLYCGGAQKQMSTGKCGVCGDAYDDPEPRDHEVGGKYVRRTDRPIVATYIQGDVATFVFQLTTNHQGWVVFKVCPTNDLSVEATQECLDSHLLELAPTSRNMEHDHRFQLPKGDHTSPNNIDIDVIIPSDLTCDPCVLQWKYHTGNTWNTDPETGESGLGVGPQEEFYACADIRITEKIPTSPRFLFKTEQTTQVQVASTAPPETTSTDREQTTTVDNTTTNKEDNNSECVAIGPWAAKPGQYDMDRWCRLNCIEFTPKYCPDIMCSETCRQIGGN